MRVIYARLMSLAAVLAFPPLATAQTTSPPATPAKGAPGALVPPPAQWHLYAGFGFGAADGKYGDVLQKPLQLDLRIAKQSASGAWRFGVGLQFGSMDPADDPNIPPETAALWLAPDKEWARLETSFSVTRVFNPRGTFRPYLQGRVGIERIHPRSELFYIQPPPENLEPGDSPTRPTNGIGFTVQPGFELALGKTLSLDIAGFATYYKTGSYDMSPLGLPDVDSGFEWGGRVGLSWQPFAASPPERPKAAPPVDPATGKLRPLPPPDAQRDAWGVRRSWGWATAEVLAIDFGASMFNEYVRNANFNQVSPRSFWANIEGRLHVRRQQVQDQPARAPLQRLDLLQRGARERDRLLGLVGDGARRRLRLGVLRRDASHVVQRHDLDRLRRHRPRRDRAPHLLADPRQHQARQGTLRAGGSGAAVRPDPRLQPRGLGRLERGEGQPSQPLRLAARRSSSSCGREDA